MVVTMRAGVTVVDVRALHVAVIVLVAPALRGERLVFAHRCQAAADALGSAHGRLRGAPQPANLPILVLLRRDRGPHVPRAAGHGARKQAPPLRGERGTARARVAAHAREDGVEAGVEHGAA